MNMIKLMPLIMELGNLTATPLNHKSSVFKLTRQALRGGDYVEHIGKTFKDDDNNDISIYFTTVKYANKEAQPIFNSHEGMMVTPDKTFAIGFDINGKAPYRDKDDRAMKTDLSYYNRLLASLADILKQFIDKINPNALLAIYYPAHNEGGRDIQVIRQRIYDNLFRANAPAGYQTKTLGKNVCLVKSEFAHELEFDEKDTEINEWHIAPEGQAIIFKETPPEDEHPTYGRSCRAVDYDFGYWEYSDRHNPPRLYPADENYMDGVNHLISLGAEVFTDDAYEGDYYFEVDDYYVTFEPL